LFIFLISQINPFLMVMIEMRKLEETMLKLCRSLRHKYLGLFPETDLPTIAQLEAELMRLDDVEVRTIISKGGTS
jgi:hypothetical protein